MARARQFGRHVHKGVKDPGCPRSFDSGCRRRRLGRSLYEGGDGHDPGCGPHRAVVAAIGRWRVVRPPQRARLRGRSRAAGTAAAAQPVPLGAGRAGPRRAVRGRELLADPGRRRRQGPWRGRRGPGGQ
jgi:hypothetical protein